MAVIVQYIVERNGIQKMTYTDKKEAEEYDKQLEIAENLFVLLETAGVAVSEEQLDQISFFLAQNKDQAVSILKGTKPKADTVEKTKPAKAKTDTKTETKTEVKKPESSEPKTPSNKQPSTKTAAA
jgi:dsDNA-binding SOS-regulon protein